MNIDAAPSAKPEADEVEYHDRPGPSRHDRDMWPYLSDPHCSGIRNGRESGMFLIGHLFGRGMHGERGLRVVLPADHVDGAVTALVTAGVTVQHNYVMAEEPERGTRACLDIWV